MAKQVETKKENLPSEYEEKYAGEGTFVGTEFSITPQIRILHQMSPQVSKNNAAYVEGAQPGMILLSNYSQPLIDGEKGIFFQPCYFSAPWMVTTPRGQGVMQFIGEYDEPQPDWTKLPPPPKGSYVTYKTPEGNEANQIHQHIGLVHIDNELWPYAIRFRSTGIFVSKNFNGLIGSLRTPSGKPAARFAGIYKMTARSRTNSQGEWSQWNISFASKATETDMRAGHELRMAVESGERKVEADSVVDANEGAGDTL
jgi:hypothetical protein